VELRPTAVEDLPQQYEVFRAAIGELYSRHKLDPPGPPSEVFRSQHEHLLEHDADRCCVAVDGSRIVGFGSAIVRDDAWFLSSLFVHPEAQARGIGSRLLDAVWGSGYRARRTLTDAIQPVSNGLYSRRGLVPATPALHLGGRPAAAAVLEPDVPDDGSLRALDSVAYGFDRSVDHAYWQRHARCTLWRSGAEAVAYSYVFPGGRVGPVAGRTGADAAGALESELAGLEEASLVVPGSSAEVVLAAVRAGLRVVRVPGSCC
jgi:GNAT superfamily N-acetyltransferase